ncbi:copper oxidase [Prauserella muralis]|uniref:Copper-containing nitrite reductase n=1 Tax=Prauserella muralis TaxID=588067 RepID=A0A2V4AJC6_9PSEU|nr:copper oxidase [Prauserella muralis]
MTAWGNLLVLAWLAVAVTLLVTHDALGLPAWLALHAFLLGAVTNAIIVWSEHFVAALCRAPSPPERRMALGLAVLNASVLLVLLGVLLDVHWLAGTGATGVSVLATVHAWHLLRTRRRALAGSYAYLTAYYAAASASLAVGGVFGGALTAGGLGGYGRMWGAHVHLTLLGWLGLSVLGTLFTLWPTALRVHMPDGSVRTARRCLPVLLAGLALAATGFAVAVTQLAVAGLVLYAAATAVCLAPFATALLRTRPARSAPWLLAAATGWLLVALGAESVWLAAGTPVSTVVDRLLPMVVVGFGAQILVGALTQLLPAVLGRGPAEHKRVAAVLDRLWLPRLVAANAAVPLVVLGLPGPWPLLGWALAAGAFGGFAVLALSVAAPVAVHGALPAPRQGGGSLAGVALGAAATLVAAGFAVSGGTGGPAPDGPVRTVDVELAAMRVSPAVITVAEGTHLMLRVTNADAMPHDLRLAGGAHTSRLSQGETELLDAGVIDGELTGWCTIAGHRAAGMTMTIRTGESPPSTQDDAVHGVAQPRNAALAPAPRGTVHRVRLRVTEREIEIAPGRHERRWTFGGTVPGPVLRGRVGDRFEITLVNDGTVGHSIDFHAGALAPNEPMRTIEPGQRLVYRFTATRAGAWLYHCSTMPMSQHIANGMYGAVIIDPPRLPPVDREYLLVGGELYGGAPGSDAQVSRIVQGRPDGWHFNGAAGQYDHAPLPARTGERVRFWVVNAGPGGTLSFHVVGGQFDTVYKEGAWLLRPGAAGGAQTLDLAAAQGGFAELTFPEPGRYPFVDHDMRHAEGGAHGIVAVTR